MSTPNADAPKHAAEKKPGFAARAKAACAAHPVLAGAAVAVITCALLWLALWCVLFSGMSGSADFIYSKF